MVQCGVIHLHCNAVRWNRIEWTRNICSALELKRGN